MLQRGEGRPAPAKRYAGVDDNHEAVRRTNNGERRDERVKQQKTLKEDEKNSVVFVDELQPRRDCNSMLLSFALI